MTSGLSTPATSAPGGIFATTHWTVVLAAGRKSTPQADVALEELCRTYWYPLYAYVRHHGHSREDAEDLTQSFFARFLEKNYLEGLRSEKGKFRAFLLAALNHLLCDERDRARAEKRGGGQPIVSIDETEAEQRYLQVPSRDLAPERVFDRRWALTVLEEALARLRREQLTSGRAQLFEPLSAFLSSEGSHADYDTLAPKLGMSASAVAVAVHRLRQRYRECIRLELAQTVASPEDLDEEMTYLFSVLSG